MCVCVCVCECLIVCNVEPRTMKRPRPDLGCYATEENNTHCWHKSLYSHVRVKCTTCFEWAQIRTVHFFYRELMFTSQLDGSCRKMNYVVGPSHHLVLETSVKIFRDSTNLVKLGPKYRPLSLKT